MKALRSVLIGLVVVGLAFFVANKALAEEGCHAGKGVNHEANITILKDAAAALQQSNPVLAKELNDYAAKEVKEMQAWKTERDAKVKMFQDAAAALMQTHPDMAKQLQEMCEAKHGHKMQKMKEVKQDETK